MTDRFDECERLLLDAQADIRQAAAMFGDLDLDSLLRLVAGVLPGLAKLARGVNDQAQDVAGNLFPGKSYESQGIKWERSHPPSRSGWRTDDLRHAVLDTKRVDPETGEVMPDETPLEKVLHVWNLGAPRVTALRERGLEPDDWCHLTFPENQPWKVMPASKKRGRR